MSKQPAWLETKIPPPLVTLFSVWLVWFGQTWLPVFTFRTQVLWALLLFMSAVVMIVLAAIELWRAKTTISPLSPKKTTTLVVKGVFTFSRNPIYLADAMLIVAATVYWGAGFGVLVLAGFVFYIDRFQIRPEERALRQHFGEAYVRYCTKVGRWL